MTTVDWEQQWALFAENFHNGMAHIDLSRYGVNATLKLKPGPGFGDLSHPTTALMLELIQGRVQQKNVLDIGSGSGILTLAAAYLGAKQTYGIDIDPEAIEHARLNAELNQKTCRFSLKIPKLTESAVCLMNMILPEQRQFDPSRLKKEAKLWITSGILLEQRDVYLEQTRKWGWELVELRVKEEWLGAVFRQDFPHCSERAQRRDNSFQNGKSLT